MSLHFLQPLNVPEPKRSRSRRSSVNTKSQILSLKWQWLLAGMAAASVLALMPPARTQILPNLSGSGQQCKLGDPQTDCNQLGISSFNLREYRKAIEFFTRALQQDPKRADIYVNRGVARRQFSDLDGAIADYTQAIALKPDFAGTYYSRGNVFAQKQQYFKAVEDYSKAVQLDPGLAEAYYARGLALRRLGDSAGAIADYTKVIELQPDNDQAYHNRAVAKAVQGNHSSAIEDYTKAINLNPDASYYVNRGRSRYILGDKQAALDDYEQAIKKDTNNSLALFYKGNALMDLKQYAAARDAYELAIRANALTTKPIAQLDDTSLAEAYRNLGAARLQGGSRQSAIEAWQQAANLYQQLGNTEKYQEVMEAIKTIQP